MRGIDDALEHLVFLAKHFPRVDEPFIIKVILIEVGIPTHLEGFECLQEAVLYCVNHPHAALSKEVYPAIAGPRGIYCRSGHIEGCIRCAIHSAWKHRDKIWCSYFPEKKRPSNGVFISRMAKMVEFWRDCVALEQGRNANGQD